MPLSTEIAQYPITRTRLGRNDLLRKPRHWWGYAPNRLESPWKFAVPYVFLPMWETFAATNPAIGFRDISGRGRNGTISVGEAPTFAGSEMGQSFQFDEINDRITIANFQYEPDQATVMVAFTLLFWFRLTDNTGTPPAYQYIFSQGALGSANTLNIYIPEEGQTPAGAIRLNIRLATGTQALRTIFGPGWIDGRWHSYAFTIDSSKTANQYADGVLRDGPFVPGGTVYNPSNVLRLGCNGTSTPSTDRFYGGQLAMFAIMKGAWSADQVLRWHQDPWGILRPPTKPVLGFRPADPPSGAVTQFLPEEVGPIPYTVF